MGLRSAIKALFKTGDKPTAAHYAELIDSAAHTTEDYDKMGGGLKEHVTSRPYKAGEAILVAGRIRISNINQVGAYNAANWTDFIGVPSQLGIPAWDPEEEVVFEEPLIQRVHRNAIYEAAADSVGVEPGVDPDWSDYWTAIVYTEGGIIPVLVSGFVAFGRVYDYQADYAPRGLYRCIEFDGGYDGGYKLSLSDFATDLAAGKWKKVDMPVLGYFDGIPADTQNVAAGYQIGISRLIDINTKIEWLYVSGTTTAVWEPVGNKAWSQALDKNLVRSGDPISITDLPAPGAGYAWVITECSGQCLFDSLAFDGSPNLFVIADGTGDGQYFADEGFVTSDANPVGKLVDLSTSGGSVLGNMVENAEMKVITTSPPSVGDSQITLWGMARLVKIPALS